MKITLLGTGYVGLVSGACFAEMGNTVTCADVDGEKIEKLRKGIVPIYEPVLENLIAHNAGAGRLFFTTDLSTAISSADVIFICVGTPPDKDGLVDLRYVFDSAQAIGQYAEGYTVVATKSTIPVGTTHKIQEIVQEKLSKRRSDATIDVVNNPEFLKEGSAVSDFMRPDRIIIGAQSPRAQEVMHSLYSAFLRSEDRVITMTIESSELTKYASNAMLASRISFMNELALLAEKVGADIEEVRQGIARDRRIGKYFLYAGAGYGGSCLPKDVSALIHKGRAVGCEMRVITAVSEANKSQKRVIVDKMNRFFNKRLTGKKIALWGLAFKPETDDVREAPAIEVVQSLRGLGAVLAVHDPVALDNARVILGTDSLSYHNDSYETLTNADALVVMTEWKEYRTPDWQRVRALMAAPAVFDGRNLYNPREMKEHGFRYFGIGHGERV